MSELHAQDVYFAGLLHGIGKLSLPDELLRKPLAKMTAEEHGLFLQHPLRAQMVLTPVAQLHKVASIVLHQYERFNGRGTPDGWRATRSRSARESWRSRATSKGCAMATSARRIRSSRRSTRCARRPACVTTRGSSTA